MAASNVDAMISHFPQGGHTHIRETGDAPYDGGAGNHLVAIRDKLPQEIHVLHIPFYKTVQGMVVIGL